jgi:hypothetical protein
MFPAEPKRVSAGPLSGVRPRAIAARARWVACLATLWVSGAVLMAQGVSEYQIKAVFLFNFAQFVEYPPAAFPRPETPLVIGVLGEDPFGPLLDETVRGERINNRPAVVRRFRQVEEIDVCHVLFISRAEMSRLDQIFERLKGRPVLTVGEVDGFAQRGGMIRFVNESNKVRMRINPETAREAGLVISSKLLRPATIVSPGRD